MTWRYHTPERDGHAPDDWVEGLETELLDFDEWGEVTWNPQWNAERRYRYRPLQDATYEPDLLAQCLALPQDQREALIEAMQKPQEPERDWAEEVWDRAYNAYFTAEPNCLSDEAAFEAIRSMCRPKEVELSEAWLKDCAEQLKTHPDVIRDLIREALS